MVENLLKDRARQMRREPTEAERRMWRLLRDRRLGGFKFRRQEQLGRYIVDFVCFEQKLIVELDGSQHAESAYDAERDAWLTSRDFVVLRFWNNEVFENPGWRSACDSDEARARMAGVAQVARHGCFTPHPVAFGESTSPARGEVDDRHGCFPPHPVGFADSTSPARGEVRMLTLIGRRLVQLLPTLFFVSVIIFSLQQLLPGDPALVMAGEERDPAVIEQIRRQYRLDQPIPIQYLYWVKGVFTGDLGKSMRLKEPVMKLILQKLPVTLQLAIMAMTIALLIGVTAGIVSAVKRDTWIDYAVNVLSLWGISTPNFWLGIMLIFLFAVTLGWLPASGYVSPWEDWRQSLATTIMPAFVLGNAIAGVIMRHTRSAMLQALQSDYVRTARAKGLEERSVVLKHAMRNALTPVITLGALEFGTLLSGAVLTEQIFTIPGFGKLIVDAVFNRDYAVVQGVVLVTATTYITLNLLADVGYILVNPRLRE